MLGDVGVFKDTVGLFEPFFQIAPRFSMGALNAPVLTERLPLGVILGASFAEVESS
ncbi:MAG TPA: hypothetical protein VGK77_03210 [Candidatus Binatia bacterium]|jgi:hypothetical protein